MGTSEIVLFITIHINSYRSQLLNTLRMYVVLGGFIMLTIETCAEDEISAPPFKVIDRLFDQSNPPTLGLPAIQADHQVLYRASQDSYKFCHHSNLVVWKDALYMMWSNGVEIEDANGQRILFSCSEDGAKWSQPVVLVEDPDGDGPFACVAAGWHDAGDTLVAYYTAIIDGQPINGRNQLFCMNSMDGKTWSKAKQLAKGFYIEGPRKLSSGRLLMNGQWAHRQPRLRYTDSADGMSGWKDAKITEIANIFTFPEPSWFVRRDGAIVVNFRTKAGDPWIYASESSDQGATWSQPSKTNFPDATARAFAGNLPSGTAFIISNTNTHPTESHPSIGQRNPLTIALSDDGVLFDRAFTLRADVSHMRFPGKNKLDGWQYPTAVTWKKHLYVGYSINKEDVGVARIAIGDFDLPRSSRRGG